MVVGPPGYTEDPPAKIFMSKFGARSRSKSCSVKLVFCLLALLFYFTCMGVSLEEVRTECLILWNWSYRLL